MDSISNFLDIQYYGNSIAQWATALLRILLSIIVGVVLYKFFGQWMKSLVKKSDSKLDDVIIDMVEEPVVVLIFLVGLRLSIRQLTLSEAITFWTDSTFEFFVPVIILWFIVRLIDAIYDEYGRGKGLIYMIISRTALFLLCGVVVLCLIIYMKSQPSHCYSNCAGANLIGMDLSDSDFSYDNYVEANLRDADLSNTNLTGADLSGATLVDAVLNNAVLHNAKLIGADLSGADLRGATLTHANLSGAILDNADMTRTDLTITKLDGASFQGTKMVEAKLSRVDLSGAYLPRSDLSGADLRRANLSGSWLSDANLSGAFLINCEISGAWLNLANLTGADLTESSLSGASLIGSRLSSANLRGSQLVGSVLVGADLGGANLESADLTGTRLFTFELEDSKDMVDPILEELNELQRKQIMKNINIGGVQFNSETVWPEDKYALLIDELGQELVSDDNVLLTIAERVIVPGAVDTGDIALPVLPELDLVQVTGDIFAAGSVTFDPLNRAITELFIAQGYQGTLRIETVDTDTGFKLFCEEGESDIVNANRPIKTEEVEACAEIVRQPVPFRLGTEVVFVVVNPANEFIIDVTLEELKVIFTAEKWSDVNPNWPAENILRFVPSIETEASDLFIQKIFTGDDNLLLNAPNTQFSADSAELVWGIVTNPYAVGFFGYDHYYKESAELIKPLTIEGVEPSVEAIERYALTRPLFMYSYANVIQQKPQVGAFINFYLNHINDIAKPAGFFPPTSTELDESKTKLQNVMGFK